MVNYDYSDALDRVRPLHGVDLSVELPAVFGSVGVVTPGAETTHPRLRVDGHRHTVRIDRLGVYAIVVFHDGDL